MILASCGSYGTEAAASELRALDVKLGLGSGQVVVSGPVTVVAWPEHGAGVDSTRALAWTGRIDSAIADELESHAGGLEGTYALVAAHRGGLVAARSLFGGRPVYYGASAAARTLYVCSRLSPLVHLLGGALAVDVDRLAAHVILRDAADARATVWRGIQRVLPGEAIRFEVDGRSRSRRTPLAFSKQPTMSIREWSDALRFEIEGAVSRATAGRRRPAVLASGGLDSSAVLAALVRPRAQSPSRPPSRDDVLALTYDFDAPCSDRPYFAALIEATKVEAVYVTPEECAHNAFSSMVLDDAPRPWPTTGMNIEILRRARERGADCVLTGIGGDFFWDLELDSIGEKAIAGDLFGAVRRAVALEAAYWLPRRRDRLRDLVFLPLARSFVPRRAHPLRLRRALAAFRYPPWAGPALRAFLRGHVERSLASAARVRDRASRMSELAWSATLADVVDGIAQVEGYVGASESHVFFDVRLARFLSTIPSDVVLANDWLRGILRSAFRDAWPKSIVERRDKGDFEPAVAIASDGLRASGALPGLARMQALGDLGLVEPAKFRAAFANDLEGGHATSDLANPWPVLTLEAFASGIGGGPFASHRRGVAA